MIELEHRLLIRQPNQLPIANRQHRHIIRCRDLQFVERRCYEPAQPRRRCRYLGRA